jgi:hypothetical protein
MDGEGSFSDSASEDDEDNKIDTEEEEQAHELDIVIDSDVDINSPSLVDMVSVEPIAGGQGAAPAQPATANPSMHSTKKPDWNF